MSETKYLIKTKSGSTYALIIKKGLFQAHEMRIEINGEQNRVVCIYENDKEYAEKLKKDVAPTPSELQPGKIIRFESLKNPMQSGTTSRIDEVYMKVA